MTNATAYRLLALSGVMLVIGVVILAVPSLTRGYRGGFAWVFFAGGVLAVVSIRNLLSEPPKTGRTDLPD